MTMIYRGEIIQIVGDDRADGKIWWIASGRDAVLAAELGPNETVTLGPYIGNAQFTVAMRDGGFRIIRISDSNSQVPEPLSDYIDGGESGGEVAWADVTGKPSVFPTNWTNVAGKPEIRSVPEIGESPDGQVLKIVDGMPAWATDANTTYSVMSEAEMTTGTATTTRAISAQRLKQAVETHGVVGNGISSIVRITQAAYDDLPEYDPEIFYVIVG